MDRSKIGFVTGLLAEAAILRGTGFLAAAGGGTPSGAARAAESLIGQEGAQALISFGLAGGLAPDLRPGALIVPVAIIEGQSVFPCDYALMEFLGGQTARPILAGSAIAATASDKAILFKSTKAAAIDLESGATARIAGRQGIPFAVLRAIADPAHRNLPRAALIPLNEDGSINLPAILAATLTHPQDIPALIATAIDAARARAALSVRIKNLKESSAFL